MNLITLEEFLYQDGNELEMKCSIYNRKEDGNGYEERKFKFISSDKGLTWALENVVNKKRAIDKGCSLFLGLL